MLFNSFEFIVFLPIVFALYWLLHRDVSRQNALLVVASYVFYGWWDWRFCFLIATTTMASWGTALLTERSTTNSARRVWMVANVVLNVGILVTFKYYNFFADNLANLVAMLGYRLDWVTLRVVLPVGISFYTFQALSYSLDVYYRRVRPTTNIMTFAAYISFFPQLVAGPIERATSLLPQFQRQRVFDYAQAVDGCRQMLWGFAQKLLVADTCATYVDTYWSQHATLSGVALLMLGMAFSMQIYCDFAGYSHIAIGVSKLFGIKLMTNFNYPYFSSDIGQFWRRWHISLTTWFRDYVYIPLGGSHRGPWRTTANIFVVWLLSGLWHGANWTFVLWGLFHGTLLLAYHYRYNASQRRARINREPQWRQLPAIMLTFVMVTLGWVMFRSSTVTEGVAILERIFTAPFNGTLPRTMVVVRAFECAAILLLIEWAKRDSAHPLQFTSQFMTRHAWARRALYALFIVGFVFLVGKAQTFIYFQF